MKVVDSLTMRAALWTIQGLYIVSLLLTFFTRCKRDLIYLSIIETALIRTDVFLIQSGIPIPYDRSIARRARSFCGVSRWV